MLITTRSRPSLGLIFIASDMTCPWLTHCFFIDTHGWSQPCYGTGTVTLVRPNVSHRRDSSTTEAEEATVAAVEATVPAVPDVNGSAMYIFRYYSLGTYCSLPTDCVWALPYKVLFRVGLLGEVRHRSSQGCLRRARCYVCTPVVARVVAIEMLVATL